jgi:hypothetical protein
MGLSIRVPDSIFGGWSWDTARFRVGLLYHSLQCDIGVHKTNNPMDEYLGSGTNASILKSGGGNQI